MKVKSLETKTKITKGTDYELVVDYDVNYQIIDDNGNKAIYSKSYFEKKKINIFKVGDKVYNHKHGWMVVSVVYLDSCTCADVNGKHLFSVEYLSFTEYTLTGFSQERPIELPEVGEVCLFSVDECNWEISEFISYDKTQNYCFGAKSGDYCAMKRVKFL